jgi:hypothetical protein
MNNDLGPSVFPVILVIAAFAKPPLTACHDVCQEREEDISVVKRVMTIESL